MTPPQAGGTPTALYRRYRPETFVDVIGQEHVTEPLMQALRSGRVGHAYLFSGPRGCGKTTSARILARCLNCAQGPTPDPCGECESCVALARGGSGTVDVIEIDAASHGGVDDARELRERASFGPAQSRYKIYIIDEAHMVTPQGFNALLKIVEEPPEHVKFIFATTEPEKVIGTIRSRTHHYPFRLVPPQRLADYMQQLCDAEGVTVEPGVLSFVTRAGGGSVRDSLSVLDQLIAGSADDGLTYAGAAALLGFTDAELLDATIDAVAASDGAATFRQVDKVIESGHDPRRFVEDLLERLRDLIIVAALTEGAGQVLRGVPEDQLERMRQQAAAFGQGTLSRAADIVNTGLTEMTGATSPRLQLELICARVLLPAASGEQGYAARLDRLERRLDIGAGGGSATAVAPAPPAPAPPAQSAPTAAAATPEAPVPEAPQSAPGVRPPADRVARAAEGRSADRDPATDAPPSDDVGDRGTGDAPVRPTATAPGGGLDTDAIRRAWPDVLDRIFRAKRVTWALLSQHAHVLDLNGERLLLGTSSPGLAQTFSRGQHPDVVRRALVEAVGLDVRVEAQADDSAPTPTVQPEQPEQPDEHPAQPEQRDEHRAPAPTEGAPAPPTEQPAPSKPPAASGKARAAAREAAAQRRQQDHQDGGWGAVSAPPPDWATSSGSAGSADAPQPSSAHVPTDESMDDEDVDDLGEVGIPVITSVLGGTIIDDQVE
ncbi:DNA polymerase III subunit gamma and tau [Leekyejoonella antrihumi]|uniref:DNA polymerase III subunit gamma/tau n=1 Tax=Leekyejoonella antrihumi TaxID=1660198 RepID=A0A563DUN0_9MICO|nr:DNA polymerase III subunit gamma and tau [Leekyejoonella antrihumi]TWP33967.1 DNA polymerase III subunit gamma and tau [Leekyejoonella antrihumi]